MSLEAERQLAGTCAFRLIPTDDLVEAPSTARLSHVGPEAMVLRYEWTHPQDGPQQGALLVGASHDGGDLEASWFDSWHQQPTLMHFTGTRRGSRIELAGTYAGEWGWQVDLHDGGATVTMTMRNVVPESALAELPPDGPPQGAGPYDVMVAAWGAERG